MTAYWREAGTMTRSRYEVECCVGGDFQIRLTDVLDEAGYDTWENWVFCAGNNVRVVRITRLGK